MDAFEARVQFTKMIQKLNGTVTSNNVAVSFMLKDKDFEEDLYDCFIEEISAGGAGGGTLNIKINALFLIDALCGTLKDREKYHHNYRTWLNRDLPEIVSKVVPSTQLGAINANSAKDALQRIQQKEFLDNDMIQQQIERLDNFEAGDKRSLEWSKEEILRRMDEDRERAKRHKENIWAVEERYAEFERLWSTQNPLKDLDYEQMREDNEIVQASVQPIC